MILIKEIGGRGRGGRVCACVFVRAVRAVYSTIDLSALYVFDILAIYCKAIKK